VIIWIVRKVFVNEPDVANARAHTGKLPRGHRLSFVVESRCKIPRHRRAVLRAADRVAAFILKCVGRKRSLAQHLRGRDCKKFRFNLPVKVRRVVEDVFGGVVDQITQEREVGSLLLPFAEIAFFHGQASALRARPASLKNNFRDNNNPNIDSALFVLIVLANPADIHLNNFADRLVVIEDARRGIDRLFVDGTRDKLGFIE
jgi:hypothetical protein